MPNPTKSNRTALVEKQNINLQQSSTTTMTESQRERERRTRLRACLFVCMKILLFFFLSFLPFIARDYSFPSSSSFMESNCDLWERDIERERAPLFPSGSFLCYFLPQNKIIFLFLFFLVSFSNTPNQRRAAQERDPFSLLSFPFLSSPLLSYPFYFVCVCVLIWTQKQSSLTTYLCYLSFPNHPPIFAPLFPFLSLPKTVLIGGGVVVLCFGLGLNHHESNSTPTHADYDSVGQSNGSGSLRLWLLRHFLDIIPCTTIQRAMGNWGCLFFIWKYISYVFFFFWTKEDRSFFLIKAPLDSQFSLDSDKFNSLLWNYWLFLY